MQQFRAWTDRLDKLPQLVSVYAVYMYALCKMIDTQQFFVPGLTSIRRVSPGMYHVMRTTESLSPKSEKMEEPNNIPKATTTTSSLGVQPNTWSFAG